MKPKLLVIDDDKEILNLLKTELAQDYDLLLAENRSSALDAFRSARPMVVLLDLGLPPHAETPDEGLSLLSTMLSLNRQVKIVIISGHNEKQHMLRAITSGAYHFQVKPLAMNELKFVLRRCFYVAQLEKEYNEMQDLIGPDSFEGMQGNSPSMRPVFETVRKVADADAPVLILGESGTGKEMVARAVHRRSKRKNGPFIAINCGAIPESLLESELFGHEKGSFTGAHAQRKGKIEMANDGTLFLDEIGEIPLPLQVKLLRFLQEQSIERVGGRQPIAVNARIVAATHVDLKLAIAQGKFREDLFYRLAVVQVTLPPLRERDSDIRLLAQYFLTRFANEAHKPYLTFDQDAIRAINKHSWPGNVRELENSLRRAVIMAEGQRITAADLELNTNAADPALQTLKEVREAAEREVILAALERHNDRVTPAAADLGINRQALYELLEKLDIKRVKE